jgi:3-oxoacyl-[acyl-carrier protein] reductase
VTTFLVTGCASGIGRDLASAIVGRGDRLLATDVDEGALQRAAREQAWPAERALLRRLDVTAGGDWDDAVARATDAFGAIDVLVNVAGYLMPAWVHEIERATIERHIRVNFEGVVLGMRAVLPGMTAAGRGHVVNVASLAALAPIEGIALYSATKYAVRGYSLAAAQELRRFGVRVTVVCPDAVRTPMLDLQRDYEQAAMTFSAPRVLEPVEVTDAILGAVDRGGPLEVWLPKSRGWLARVADVFPRASMAVGPLLRRQGRRRQRKTR